MRPIKARISIDAMAHNLRVARSHAGTACVFAVVKANAYGHGLSRALRALAAADGLAVLTLEEAANLRLMGVEKPILLLEGIFGADEIATCAELDLWPVLHQAVHLDWLQQQPPARPLQVFLKFDSGMHRLGFPLADHAAVVARVRSLPGVAGITLMTHFAQADEAAGVDWQLQPFLREMAGHDLTWSSANSAALLRYPETLGAWVRPGIMLYGASPFAEVSAEQLGLRPAMTLQSEIISVQTLQAGEGGGLRPAVSRRTRDAGGGGGLRLCGRLSASRVDGHPGAGQRLCQPNPGSGVDGHAVRGPQRVRRCRGRQPGGVVGGGAAGGWGGRSCRHQQL